MRRFHALSVAAFLLAAAGAGLSGCGKDEVVAAPSPATLTDEAIGYYCNMTVVHHLGPKGQVHLPGQAEPLWFASVRDTLAFTMLPEEPKNVAAIYVSDMGQASWDHPEPGTWTDARSAWFVVGSERTGGMGAPETVPFSQRDAADKFAQQFGGTIVRFDEIPQAAILGTTDSHSQAKAGMSAGNQHTH